SEAGRARYAVLWLKSPARAVETQLAAGVDEAQLQARDTALRNQGYWRGTTSVLGPDEAPPPFSVPWSRPPGRKPPTGEVSADAVFVGDEADYSGENFLADLQVDVQLSVGAGSAGAAPPRYAAVWHPVAGLTSAEVHSLDPVRHLAKSRELIAHG